MSSQFRTQFEQKVRISSNFNGKTFDYPKRNIEFTSSTQKFSPLSLGKSTVPASVIKSTYGIARRSNAIERNYDEPRPSSRDLFGKSSFNKYEGKSKFGNIKPMTSDKKPTFSTPKLTSIYDPTSSLTSFDVNACRICGRKFELPERKQKHETICSSNALKKRPQFDSTEQRFKGKPKDYIESYENSLNKTQQRKPPRSPKSNWRQQHEYFIAAIRAAKGTIGPSTAELTAAMLSPCIHCKRRFNKLALERHLPICAKLSEKQNRQRRFARAY